mmetsp:Transcript_26113/g.65825  ORF Transcript_26113/g.65825 Transcript_26113/m.65825 type:complete len:213 (+) Transcript_26113:80-718(+)
MTTGRATRAGPLGTAGGEIGFTNRILSSSRIPRALLLLLLAHTTTAPTVWAQTKHTDKCAPYYDAVEKNTLGSTTFLAITSTGGKVLWTQVVDNSLASDGRALALVDSGLTTPNDLAYDPRTGRVFVADVDGKNIVSYKLYVHVDENRRKSLKIRGDRVVVVENFKSSYLAVDLDGNLYFTVGEVRSGDQVAMTPTSDCNQIRYDLVRVVGE